MSSIHDGKPDANDLADVTLFGHLDAAKSSIQNYRPVRTSPHQNPEEVLFAGDGRYDVHGMIGRGGAGEVHRVLDKKLNRVVALKLLRAEYNADPQMIARFVREAQVISQLEHPSIIPIYDLGRADTGRWYLTMKEVHGRTLRECIAEAHANPGELDHATLRQAIQALQRVATAVGFAHSKGVLHRDLKPDNIMIAEFGQVYVLDWGLARVIDSPVGKSRREASTRTDGQTDHGLVLGTPAYMSPEQARADSSQIGTSSDVWSIGATLYAILYGRAPYSGSAEHVIEQVEMGPPVSPPRTGLPHELVDLWKRCMQLDPDKRPPNGTAVAAELTMYLEGRRNQERALKLLDDASALFSMLEEARRVYRSTRESASAAIRTLRNSDDLETKEQAWNQEDRADEALIRLDRAYDQVMTKVRMAHDQAPRLDEVRAMLAKLYRQRAEDAQAQGDSSSVRNYKALVETYDDGRHRDFLLEEGELLLDWNPRSAKIRVSRFELRSRRLVAEPLKNQEFRPGVPRTLLAGSYLVELGAPSRTTIRVPIHIRTGRTTTFTPPGASHPVPIRLHAQGQLAKQERYVAGGWFVCGGDGEALESLPKQRLWADPFSIAARPVSHQEYLLFLNHICKDNPTDATRFSPSLPDADGVLQPLYQYDPITRNWSLHHQVADLILHPSNPVVGIRWSDTQAYLLWLGKQTGLPWRLPSELEWELAARGTDGRSYPWGNRTDPAFFCHRDTHLEVLGPPATGRFPVDSSPYKVMGMAGGVSDWCADKYHPRGPELNGPRVIKPKPPSTLPEVSNGGSGRKAVRGGAWSLSAAHGRCASRRGHPAEHRASDIGFRICRDISQGASNR